MQKDVIYIDVEDDITAIIGKVKAAEHHIVALVPPKRIGAIQSAVNLKLVHRAAEQVDKRLVIISNNAALMALAGSAGIPVAKNLQSKPELAEIPALDVDDGEDIIDGTDAPGAAEGDGDTSNGEEPVAAAAATDETVGKPKRASKIAAPAAALGATALAAKDKVKIPNFDSFRKKLLIGLGALVLLIGFLVWAMVFAPHATVVITARTTDSALNSNVTLGQAVATDLKAGTIKAEVKTAKKDVSIPFTATGKKDVGEKSTATVKLYNDSFDAVTVSGAVSAGGFNFVLSSTTVPKGSCSRPSSCSPGTATGTITAAASGANTNGVSGSLGGLPTDISGSIVSATTGGTDKTVTVVQQSDVDAVSNDVLRSGEAETAKSDLKKQFGSEYIVLDGTFKSDTTGVKPSPAVGSEASDGKGTLGGSVTFSLVGISKKEAGKYLDAYFAQQIDGRADQKVYRNGVDTVAFTNFVSKDDHYTANISTNGKIGPKIDEAALKEFAKGKRYGEIQSHVQATNGVDNVDVKFSPFWVSTAPGDVNKISIEFKVNGA